MLNINVITMGIPKNAVKTRPSIHETRAMNPSSKSDGIIHKIYVRILKIFFTIIITHYIILQNLGFV